ncbi:MAG: hypothetical protein HC869_14750, partial [Rhodospirillales bacterium]|nr:hypothetical protein [Rhodospirillales bacterium]
IIVIVIGRLLREGLAETCRVGREAETQQDISDEMWRAINHRKRQGGRRKQSDFGSPRHLPSCPSPRHSELGLLAIGTLTY